MSEIEKPDITVFRGDGEGPSLLVFGAIHGDEVCGPEAIKRVCKDIESGKVRILRGDITFVPVCNPEAYSSRVRFTQDNLNRYFKKWDDPDSYEKRLANQLTELVDECDIMLDIHSMETSGETTVFIDFPTKDNTEFAHSLGAKYALLDWPALYEREGQGVVSYDTTAYAYRAGKIGVIMECGQHDDPEACDVAYESIIRTLKHFGFIDGDVEKREPTAVYMERLFIKKHPKDHFSREWKHLDAIKKGEVVAETHEEVKILAPFDGVILFPKYDPPLNSEWFYLGEVK